MFNGLIVLLLKGLEVGKLKRVFNVERLKSFKDLEMEGLVHCGRCSPVIRFTPLHSVFATTGFILQRGEAFG